MSLQIAINDGKRKIQELLICREFKESVGNLLESTTSYLGCCQRASKTTQRAEPITKKERAKYDSIIKEEQESQIRQWFTSHNLFIHLNTLLYSKGAQKIAEGAEQEVFLTAEGKTVFKLNNGSFHSTWLDYLTRLVFHNTLFPETAYSLIGFTETGDELKAIIEQPFFKLSRGAPREIVEEALKNEHFHRLKNDDYYNDQEGVILEDLHDENIFLEEGQLIFIDPVIYLETPTMQKTSSQVFRFPFDTL